MRTKNTTQEIFPRANTIVCMEDSKLLRQPQYELLYSVEGLDAALHELNSMNYFRTYKSAQPDNYSELFDSLVYDTLGLLYEITPTNTLWRMFALYYDIHNMKLVVKERHLGRDLEELALRGGSYSFITIRSAAVRATDNVLKNDTLTEGFHAALYPKRATVDSILERTYFTALSEFSEQLKSPLITEFVLDRIDLHNISAFLQAQANDTPLYFEMA